MPKPYRNSIVFGHKRTLIALLSLGALLSGCKKTEDVAPPEVSVQAEKVERKPLTTYVSGETILVPRAQAAILPKISAPIKKVFVPRGRRVKQSEFVALPDNVDLPAAFH